MSRRSGKLVIKVFLKFRILDRIRLKIARLSYRLGAIKIAQAVGDSAFNRGIAPPYLPRHVSVGRHTYRVTQECCILPTESAYIKIGNFCSIAEGVKLLAHTDHPTNLATTYPLRTLLKHRYNPNIPTGNHNYDAVSKGPINIEHDVWIATNALILSGVTIGTGSIIGAGAVVTKSIPPYSIAVGNPARVIRKRFPDDTIDRLLASKWWELPDEDIIALDEAFYDRDIERFLQSVTNIWASRG